MRKLEYENLYTDGGTLPWLCLLVIHEALAVGCCPHPCWTRVQGARKQSQCVGLILGPSSRWGDGILEPQRAAQSGAGGACAP